MTKQFKPQDIEQFVKDHIQSKINHNELAMVGLDLNNKENFERELQIYSTALFEGICNGIIMCDGTIEGIEIN